MQLYVCEALYPNADGADRSECHTSAVNTFCATVAVTINAGVAQSPSHHHTRDVLMWLHESIPDGQQQRMRRKYLLVSRSSAADSPKSKKL